jgi:hypothetical protein
MASPWKRLTTNGAVFAKSLLSGLATATRLSSQMLEVEYTRLRDLLTLDAASFSVITALVKSSGSMVISIGLWHGGSRIGRTTPSFGQM